MMVVKGKKAGYRIQPSIAVKKEEEEEEEEEAGAWWHVQGLGTARAGSTVPPGAKVPGFH